MQKSNKVQTITLTIKGMKIKHDYNKCNGNHREQRQNY